MPLLAAFLWFAEPSPLDMPEADAYLVTDSDDAQRIEDRFDELDLWISHAVLGRWRDADGRLLTILRIDTTAPVFSDTTLTRENEFRNRESLDAKNEEALANAVSQLSPFALPIEPSSPRQEIRGMKEVFHYNGTNDEAMVCAFLPERHPYWYLALWQLVDGDSIELAKKEFEDTFLADWSKIVKESLKSEIGMSGAKPLRRGAKRQVPPERELLKADVCHSITNYPNWHFAASEEFAVIDNLPNGNGFIRSLTNELVTYRALYAKTIPSPLNVSNILAVARIYQSRDEYLAALDDNEVEGMEWSAAYWSPRRREIVAYLPPDGDGELLRTFRHEAFHQYLSYACSMIPASPWINEGYAQYFEDVASADWKIELDLDEAAEILPGLLLMDYTLFYAGSDAERFLKYRLAWSIAYFLEHGAPKLRFEPYKAVKEKYINTLLRKRNMHLATMEAFGGREEMDKFAAAWLKYWKNK